MNRARWGLLTILAVALVLRLVGAMFLAHTSPDSLEYLGLASELAQGHGFSNPGGVDPNIERGPLYPVLLALPLKVGVDPQAPILLLQVLADTATTAILAASVRVVFGRRDVALLAAGLYACSPFAIFATASLLTETLFTFFVALSIFCLTSLYTSASRSRTLVATGGTSAALASLTRANGFPLFVLLGVFIVAAFLSRRARRPALARALALLVLGFVLIAPWTARNFALTGLLVPVTGGGSGSWLNAYVATRWDLDQRDETTFWPAVGHDPVVVAAGEGTPRERVLASARMLPAALANVRANPLAYVRSRALAYPQLWLTTGDFMAGASSTTFVQSVRDRDVSVLARKVGFLLLFSIVPLVLAVAGMLSRRTWSVPMLLFSSLLVVTAVSQLVMWTEPRLLWVAYPYLCGWAACGWMALRERLRPAPSGAAVAPAAVR